MSFSARSARSTAINKARLKRIAARQMRVNEAVKSAAKSLAELSKDQSKYSKLCVDLITQASFPLHPPISPQGMFQLLETEVLIRCRKEDQKIIESSIEAAEKKYMSLISAAGISNVKIKASIDTNNYLLKGPDGDETVNSW